eukprot:TRINITY_DN36408_c0_g1_i1.p1 TRINITY_DN36408_c0_g1~~TRINITY_DN36408_c0_g1_i1.p1  ORF type:complete len:631 (-),score=108.13 TRINITY_DN36408_c0_g1_i1:186-2078(-)
MSGPRGCLFAPQELGALFSHAGGRWKLWRESEAAVEVSHNDASESYTAICWIGSSKGEGSVRLALGCASGRIQAWDPSAGEMIGPVAEAFRAVAQGADCAVSGLACPSPSRGTVLAACNGTPEILEVGLADGTTRSSFRAGKAGICRLAATLASGKSSKEWLLAASPGSPLKVWQIPGAGASLSSSMSKAHLRLAPPANPATSLDMCCTGGRLLALSTDGTMRVDFFDIGPEGGAKEEADGSRQPPKASARVLSCHERLSYAQLARSAAASGSSGQLLALGFGSTIVACWIFEAGSSQGSRTVAPSYCISNAELGGKILSARPHFPSSSSPVSKLSLVVAYGPAARPSFVQVSAPKSKGGSAQVVPISGQKAKPVASDTAPGTDAKVAADNKTAPTVLGPAEIAATRKASLKRGAEEASAQAKKQKLPMPASRPASAGSNLSLAPVLRQGLRAKDTASLDSALVIKDREVMDTSVAELSGSEAFDLLQECAKRLLQKPLEGQVYCAWIQRVLLYHCTFICSQPALQQALLPLHEATSARCESYRGLVRLRGRLQSLVSCGRQVSEKKSEERVTIRAPLLEYVEGDEDLGGESAEEEAADAGDDKVDEDGSSEDVDIDDDWLDSEDDLDEI